MRGCQLRPFFWKIHPEAGTWTKIGCSNFSSLYGSDLSYSISDQNLMQIQYIEENIIINENVPDETSMFFNFIHTGTIRAG